MSKGVLLIVSGPSGCGKGTVLQHVLKNEEYSYSVSATTRAPREGEIDGKHYHFMTKAQFEHCIANDKILEYTVYCDNMYGTPREFVEEQLLRGVNVVLEIETEGAFNVKRLMPDALSVFISPPDMETLETRLRGRGTEDNETVEKRLAKAREEMLLADRYDVVIVNKENGAEEAASEILKAVESKRNSL
ncbi:MAG: guanylate kinase [Clostridia bacterium]|nr:guanylate kinase [Clostridia bacterium]